MKKIALFSVCAGALMMMLPACNGNANKQKEAENQNVELNDSLQTALAEQDSLMTLLTEVNDGMTQIKELENLMSSPNLSGETASKKDEIKANMTVIQQALQNRRTKLDAMELKLKQSGSYNSKMQKTIESMKEQLAAQEKNIATLQEALKNANIQIEGLTNKVTTLNSTVETVSTEKKAAQEEAVRVANELNTCYYVIGSKSELKKNKIVESGFLRKTKIMEGDFEKSYFTKADKRTISELPLHAKKAKLLSKHPQGSYEIVDNDGVKTLKITNSTKFWELSNFLIIQIN
ncbi:MAG: hypothetical protein RR061_08855 [Muribaculaceae bacterium]